MIRTISPATFYAVRTFESAFGFGAARDFGIAFRFGMMTEPLVPGRSEVVGSHESMCCKDERQKSLLPVKYPSPVHFLVKITLTSGDDSGRARE